MHIGLRTIFATLVVGLALAPAALADTANETLSLARDACGTGANNRLDWGAGADGSGCGNLVAGLEPVLVASGAGNLSEDYPAVATAFPTGGLTLDTARPVVIDVSIDSYSGPPLGGVGDETVAVDLTGRTTTNKTVDIASGSQTTAATDEIRNGHYVVEFKLPLPAAAATAFKSLNLNLDVGGAQFGGFVNADGSSFVQLPIPGLVDAVPPDA